MTGRTASPRADGSPVDPCSLAGPVVGTVDLGDGCWLRHEPSWLERRRADELVVALRSELDWEQRSIVMFGREVMQPRLVAWAGDLPYRYSGKTLPPKEAPAPLAEMLQRVSEACDHPFNHVLANRYRDGRDSMGMHSDDEPELGPAPLVASLSLGAPRRFVFVTKDKPRSRHHVLLDHGGLLVMGGRFQHRYRHGLPKQPASGTCGDGVQDRVSLTFRRVLRPPR